MRIQVAMMLDIAQVALLCLITLLVCIGVAYIRRFVTRDRRYTERLSPELVAACERGAKDASRTVDAPVEKGSDSKPPAYETHQGANPSAAGLRARATAGGAGGGGGGGGGAAGKPTPPQPTGLTDTEFNGYTRALIESKPRYNRSGYMLLASSPPPPRMEMTRIAEYLTKRFTGIPFDDRNKTFIPAMLGRVPDGWQLERVDYACVRYGERTTRYAYGCMGNAISPAFSLLVHETLEGEIKRLTVCAVAITVDGRNYTQKIPSEMSTHILTSAATSSGRSPTVAVADVSPITYTVPAERPLASEVDPALAARIRQSWCGPNDEEWDSTTQRWMRPLTQAEMEAEGKGHLDVLITTEVTDPEEIRLLNATLRRNVSDDDM